MSIETANISVTSNTLQSVYSEKRGNVPSQQRSEITYEFTDDKVWLEKYSVLRRSLYEADPKFKGFRDFSYSGYEDYKEPGSAMLVGKSGKRCAGGGRLTICSPGSGILLPLERDVVPPPGKEFYRLKDQFPELNLEQVKYCEFNRIVINPFYRYSDCMEQLFRHIFYAAKLQGVKYLFGFGDFARGRVYRTLVYKIFKIKGIFLDSDVPIKEDYEGVKMRLMMCCLDDVIVPDEILNDVTFRKSIQDTAS